jgi:lipid II:glycine glycyltransferase (peptidoglycan interpeptide bridge formation enzyme)
MKKLSFASQPSPGILISALSRKKLINSEISIPWVRYDEDVFWLSRTAYSLELIALWQLKVRRKDRLVIWLPDYFCNAALEPLRNLNVSLIFYPITAKHGVVSSVLEELAALGVPDVVVNVHFFGIASGNNILKQFCINHNCLFVEDAAHVLKPLNGIGDEGDCVLYSPHKHLPIRDGAAIVVRKNGPSQLGYNKDCLNALKSIYDDFIKKPESTWLLDIVWISKRTLQYFGYRKRIDINRSINEKSVPDGQKLPPRSMSTLSKKILARLKIQLNDLSKQRAKNVQLWQSVMQNEYLSAMVDQSNHPQAAYMAAFKINTGFKASDDDLNMARANSMSWPDLPPEVLKNPVRHKIAINLKNEKIFFPVHHSIKEAEICKQMKNANRKTTQNWKVRPIDENEWNRHLSMVNKQNLLHSWDYGSAKSSVVGWNIERLAVEKPDGDVIALVQVLCYKLFLLGGIAKISRGPLLLDSHSENDRNYILTLLAITEYARSVKWRIIQFSLEIPQSKILASQLRAYKFYKQKTTEIGSGLLDLKLDLDALHSNLNRIWKRTLKKIEKHKIVVRLEPTNDLRVKEFLKLYSNMQKNKAFEGINSDLIKLLLKKKSSSFEANFFIAEVTDDDGMTIELGTRVCIKHGNTATDLLLCVNDEGKKYWASTALYWYAIKHYKALGCKWFDIGGLNENTTKGISDYKKGLRPDLYTLMGEWRYYALPIPFKKITKNIEK